MRTTRKTAGPSVDRSRDHFVSRTYLRGFPLEYLRSGRKGGELAVYRCVDGRAGICSINREIACEVEYYAGHPLDEFWSRTIEAQWPKVRRSLTKGEATPEVIEKLSGFVAAQMVRVPSFMTDVGADLAWRNATVQNGGLFAGVTATAEVMEELSVLLPWIQKLFVEKYRWTVLENPTSEQFLTSDNPCCYCPQSYEIVFPVSLNLVLCGAPDLGEGGGTLRHGTVSSGQVMEINRKIVRNAEDRVYAHELTEYLSTFVRENYVPPPPDRIEGRSFAKDGEPMTPQQIERMVSLAETLRAKG